MFCRSKGMDLVAIESSEEQDYLVQLISPFGKLKFEVNFILKLFIFNFICIFNFLIFFKY